MSRASSFGDHLRLGELRVERLEQHHGRHAADGELARAIQEAAAVDVAVHVCVEQDQEFLVEISCRLALHVSLLSKGPTACRLHGYGLRPTATVYGYSIRRSAHGVYRVTHASGIATGSTRCVGVQPDV